MTDLLKVCEEVKRRIIPNQKLRSAVQDKAEEIRSAVENESRKAGLTTEVRIDGSVAKDTWLKDYADVDIFMRVSPSLSKEQLRDVCLPIAKRALAPNPIVERYAEHPYVESYTPLGKKGTLRVNVVPCYNVKPGQWLSATDRSPYHTEYIHQHLRSSQRDEVRLLKAFMRGIGAYGADIKTGGFSGMLCETLILAQQDFQSVLKRFSDWEETSFIDLENYFEGRTDEAHRLFREPLIVIDPVDKGRNLAAAVRSDQLWTFAAASRQLLAKPSKSFFEEPRISPLNPSASRRLLNERASTILAIVMGTIDVPVDILWSQLYKTERALVSLLESNDFSIIRSSSWSNEHSLNVTLLELEQDELAASRRHVGPPISRVAESAAFVRKHVAAGDTLSGPWVEGDRWVVLKERKHRFAIPLLKASLKSGGRNVGVASEPAQIFRRGVTILKGPSVGRLVNKSPEFGIALKAFLSGRPNWLD